MKPKKADENEKKRGDLHAEDENDGGGPEVTGDPTEVALLVLAEKSNIRQQDRFDQVEVIDDLPFNSEQKYRASLVRYENGVNEIFVVGAPERMIELSTSWISGGETKVLDQEQKDNILAKIDQWADDAMRVIALGFAAADKDMKQINPDDLGNITITGLAGIIDPPREGVREAIESCKNAGIRVIMLTGDHKKTASAIAEEVGILESRNEENGKFPIALSEKELNERNEDEFTEIIGNTNVFARVSPQVKLKIAEHLQDQGELIGMTGDGVNDAPALKRADVGIAMGMRGTDVAKDAAQIVLSDDNFTSIVQAIREGRIIFKNVRITTYFLLTTNFASTSTLIASLVIGLPIPLTAIQILWVNLVTDGVMDVALATEPGHGTMMDRPPIKKDEKILNKDIIPFLLIQAAIMVTLAIFAFKHYLPEGLAIGRTGAFVIIAMTQVFNVFNMRDINKSIFEIGFFSNKWVNIALVASLFLQIAVIQLPFLKDLFDFSGISMVDFFILTAVSTTVLWAGEAYKYIKKKFFAN